MGPTGSGKTTLVMLIPRLYDVTRAPCWSTAPTCATSTRVAAREVAVVSDDAFLFSATLRDNIAYARPEASDEQRVAAAERAGLDELLDDLPDGLDTLVGERGLTLSGGQRQRVAIARALLAEPRILILDDATSSVDATTESRIKDALREVMEGRTTFVIAHRLSTIALADEVVVLEDGEVAARGPTRSCWRTRRSTARSPRRACPTRCSSPATTPSARWRGCERALWGSRRARAAAGAQAAPPRGAAAPVPRARRR